MSPASCSSSPQPHGPTGWLPWVRSSGAQQLFLALNAHDLMPLNRTTFFYYEQPSNFTSCLPSGGPTRGGTAVTITGGPCNGAA